MSTYTLMPVPVMQFLDLNGDPLAGGLLYTYQPGTVVPKASYTDSTGSVPNTNPVILDAAGRAPVWLDGSYRMRLTDADGNAQWDADNVVAGDQVQFATLQNNIDNLATSITAKAPLSSPALIGVPTAPTPNSVTSTTQIATTAFVHNVIDEGITSITYVGMVAFFAMPAAPSGWLPCDGGAYSRTSYANLFALIGTTFGNGDGTSTFNVPDIQNRYVTGWDAVKTFGTTEQLSTTGSDGPTNIILYACIKA